MNPESDLPESAFGVTEGEVASLTEAWMQAETAGDEQALADFARRHGDRLVTQLGRLWMALRDVEGHVHEHGCACERVERVIRAALRR